MSKYPNDYFHYKSIRDPLYGFINLSETEIKLIDTPIFRRLLNIKQLSHSFVVYPSAIHTRFEHAIGATHIANRICDQLELKDEVKEIVRIATLLHDIGHGPFSHLFEDVLKYVVKISVDHEDISKHIIKHDKDIQEILGEKNKQVLQLLKKEPVKDWTPSESSLAADIVSGPLDADKLDYLRRDSYHIGVAYGQFDLERIIHTIKSTPGPADNEICIDGKGKDSIENYRLGRYLMHAQVYQHHARIVADKMFLQAMDLAINKENIIDINKFKFDVSSPSSIVDFLNFYTSLDDKSIYDMVIRTQPTSKAAKILINIIQRRLLKKIYEFYPHMEISHAQIREKIMKMENDDVEKMANEIATKTALDQNDVIVYKSEIPVNLYEGEILILWKGVPRTLDEFSPIKTSQSTVIKFYVYGPNNADSKTKIKQYIIGNLQLPPET